MLTNASIVPGGSVTGSLSDEGSLSGRLSDSASLKGSISSDPDKDVLAGKMSGEKSLSAIISGEGNLNGSMFKSTAYSSYSGPYEVVPNMSEQVLGTKSKVMNDDVVVVPIPVYSVANTSGGNTVTIGGLISYG